MDLALPGIFRSGASIKLKGTLVDGAMNSFTLQLATPEGVALYMFVPAHGQIILNSFKAGRWELEERHMNAVKPGHHVHLKIKHSHEFLIIKINGHVVTKQFYHRDLPQKMRTLFIRGDIHVADVHFKKFKHQHRDGPAVVVHSSLPTTPVIQQIIVPQPQQPIVVQTAPPTVIQQPVQIYPQLAQQPSPTVVCIPSGNVPPSYESPHQYPALPVKM